MSEKVYIVGAKRTAIGTYGGGLSGVHTPQLGAISIEATLQQAGLAPDAVDEVIAGNVLSAGLGMGPARQAAMAAGVPESVPAYTLNMICGSGMKAIMEGCSHIRSHDADVVAACGFENMSSAPFLMPGAARFGLRMGDQSLVDVMIKDGLTDVFNQYHMGITAENVAERYSISREAQDAFALASQQKAVAAQAADKFIDEIISVETTVRRKTQMVEADEYPRTDASLESLSGLRAAFKKDGTVTAGNASGLNDGGAAVLLVSQKAVEQHDLTPLAEVVATGQAGVSPEIMGIGPAPAITNALNKAGLSLKQMQAIELNEAFAAQSLAVIQLLAKEHGDSEQAISERTNVNGGAIALGHPIGASGARIVVSLLHQMLREKLEYGLASLCIGGGMGTALVLKAV